MQAIFESIEAKFGAEVVKNIFKQFDDVDLPMSFVDRSTYQMPLAVSSDSDDISTSDDDSISCSQHVKALTAHEKSAKAVLMSEATRDDAFLIKKNAITLEKIF